ncbi:hypothetical protein V2J09_018897 [Rumex salicifolius]
MCHQNSCVLVSVEEAGAAEECLLVYCKPVELYNILLRRAQHNMFEVQSTSKEEEKVSEEYQAVNVSVKVDDLQSEAHGSSHIELELPDSKSGEQNNQPETRGAKCAEPALDGLDPVGIPVARAQSFEDTDCIQIVSSDQASLLQNAKTKKVFMERADLKNGALLQKRQFYHSHRAQPMAMDQVLADRDSEDEIDYTISGLEDRRMLDDFVDVTKDEKHLMHLWNSFVRKQRVLADGHVSWACEAFLQLHGQDLKSRQITALFQI